MSSTTTAVQPGRIRILKKPSLLLPDQTPGPVVYWMFRDQRLRDNWALIHAVDLANRTNAPVAVVFNLFDQFLGAKARQLGFMLKGLRQIHRQIESLQIPFFLLQGDAKETIPEFMKECGASHLVTDFSPLREIRSCKEEVVKRTSVALAIDEVDAHNVVPMWAASGKLEYSARTIRGKINKLLPEYLVEFPEIEPPKKKWGGMVDKVVDWDSIIDNVVREGAEVPEVEWCVPGEDSGMEVLMGRQEGFLTKRLRNYSTDRNNPVKPKALSGLSPYLHFGQISAQRLEQLEKGQTADPLWNASQLEMVYQGKMHGFMRQVKMYWAKKILEWTKGPEEALSISIFLNNKYELDGRDPSGYVGCMWSICGVHDQGWKERPVFGKIRYMNYAGCKRKFNVDSYISYVKSLVSVTKKKRKAEEQLTRDSIDHPKAK
uniref:Deoxyribodipyrimidine photo-lyase n=1 Tax=Brassica campestris TaxID=3711 RepID=M4DJU8_BRACM